MADSSTLKEFLVCLGFKVDETAMKKFSSGVTNITKGVITLGKEVEVAALAVAIGVAKFAANLEQLYFAAKRTGSSADELKAFGLAAQNFGASAGEALGSVEALAAFMRNNPAGNSLIKGWLSQAGIDTKNLSSTMDYMRALGLMFARQNAQGLTWRSNIQAGQLGISDRTMLAMADPGFAKELERDEKRSKGWAAITKAAHMFEMQLRALKMQLEQMLFGLQGPVMSALERIMTELGRLAQHHGKALIKDFADAIVWLIDRLGDLLTWLDSHGKEIRDDIDSIFKGLKEARDTLKPALEWLLKEFADLNTATDGWLAKILLLTLALKTLGAGGIVNGIASLGTAFTKGLLSTAAEWSAAGGLWTVAGWALGSAAAIAIGVGIGALFNKLFPNNWLAQGGAAIGGAIQQELMKLDPKLIGYTDANQPTAWDPTHTYAGAPVAPGGTTNNNIVNHKTDVHVNGSGDPHTVASDVVREQERIARLNASIVREFAQGAQ